ncbi:MAG: TIGR03617 family F420-dependent LLM class oxidoreductase [Gammaproteobacteria bacterium]|nr:MAG: TIGR03617 family F420-dependent LLM class oxidoreductase [Gammaproteobacteria bacterium]
MKLNTNLVVDDLNDIADAAQRIEAMGFHAMYVSERKHDPFMQLAVAATTTSRMKLGPEIALAFPRNPMVLAYTAWDLQRASKGRFVLGLGTQVKAHNERRFSLEWNRPGPKLREYVLVIRAIWDCFQNGTELDFKGEFFHFNLMTPMFNPGPLEYGPPPIYLGAVNPWNCRMAGEVADGFHCHGFHTAKTLRENVINNIEAGLAKAGRQRSDFTITAPVMAVMGDTPAERDTMRERVRGMIGFYGATSYYKDMFAAHNWEGTFNRLLEKSRTGQWDSMASEITDEMLAEFAVEGSYEEIPGLLQAKYGDMIDEVLIYFGEPEKGNPETWKRLVKAFEATE